MLVFFPFFIFFFFNDTATTEIYTLSLHDALPIYIFQLFYYPRDWGLDLGQGGGWGLIHPTEWFYNSYLPGDYRDRKSTRLNSSHSQISYAVFCLKKKKKK